MSKFNYYAIIIEIHLQITYIPPLKHYSETHTYIKVNNNSTASLFSVPKKTTVEYSYCRITTC